MGITSAFRRYHRQFAIIMCLPLALTIISGITYPIFAEWFSLSQVAGIMLNIHSGRIFGLEAIYPILNGLGLAGLMITGLSMSSLFRKKRSLSTTLNEVSRKETARR
ncbi:peptidase [Oculatella sp. LEGE 06141]|uniref:peptidase n=1 Tax=Oculatella sp. LEGE 06141 TaxID=1828648 RepID=UPI00187EBADB|nr:peptidase [Oculatella sp. LEGE 06141]MBE9179141.1 peptidase [Oculatella sp. LEGE 06141]